MARKLTAARSAGSHQSDQNLYLVQYAYTASAWNDLLKPGAQRDRAKAVKDLVGALGGCFAEITIPCSDGPKMREKFGSFGEYDVVTLLAFPSDTAMAAFAMAISAGGLVSSFKTTKLLAWDQMMAAMELAGAKRASYQASPKK